MRIGERVSRKKNDKAGTVVEANTTLKVKWDAGGTSYFLPECQSNLRRLDPSIPRILCPRCATKMRLAQVGPTVDRGEVMKFDCSCGFEYEMAAKARNPSIGV